MNARGAAALVVPGIVRVEETNGCGGVHLRIGMTFIRLENKQECN